MYYFCIAQGQADFSPDTQDYHAAETAEEMTTIVNAACAEFEREELEGQDNGKPYRHEFRAPSSPEVTNWSQRLMIAARNSGYVLDVIGMTADEYEHENEA